MSSLGREHSSFLSWWFRVPKFLSCPSSLFSLFLHHLLTFYIKNINRWMIVIFLFPVFLYFVVSDVLFCWLLLLLLLFCFVFICLGCLLVFYWKLDLVYWARTEINSPVRRMVAILRCCAEARLHFLFSMFMVSEACLSSDICGFLSPVVFG